MTDNSDPRRDQMVYKLSPPPTLCHNSLDGFRPGKKVGASVSHIEDVLNEARHRLLNHHLYELLSGAEAVRHFMGKHVFCVWDFQYLLKGAAEASKLHAGAVVSDIRPGGSPDDK